MTKKLSNLIRPILISSSFAIVFVCSAGYSANKPLHAIQCVRLVLPGLDRYSDQIKVHVSETMWSQSTPWPIPRDQVHGHFHVYGQKWLKVMNYFSSTICYIKWNRFYMLSDSSGIQCWRCSINLTNYLCMQCSV